jgi:hypothetical protein
LPSIIVDLEVDEVTQANRTMQRSGSGIAHLVEDAVRPAAEKNIHRLTADQLQKLGHADAEKVAGATRDFEIVSEILHDSKRDIVVVRLPDGRVQSFYRSLGESSSGAADNFAKKRAGEWTPFDGIEEKGCFLGQKFNRGYFQKETHDFAEDSDGYLRAIDPLFRDVDRFLQKQNIGQGVSLGIEGVNNALEAAGARVIRDYKTFVLGPMQ